MVLSNAERQKRYRERMKATAKGERLAEQVYAVFRAAIEAASADGGLLIDTDGNDIDFDQWVRDLHDPKSIRHNGTPIEQIERVLRYELRDTELQQDRRSAIERAIALLEAATLLKP